LGQKAERNKEKEGKKDFHRIGKIKGNQSTRRKKNGKRCEDYRLFFEFLASTLSVAWGTASKRSFGISFPVSRQTP